MTTLLLGIALSVVAAYIWVRPQCFRKAIAMLLRRNRCQHAWEEVKTNGQYSHYAVGIHNDISMMGVSMPACAMRICQHCLRAQVSMLSRGKPAYPWRDVEYITQDDAYFAITNGPAGQMGTCLPKGSPIIRRGWRGLQKARASSIYAGSTILPTREDDAYGDGEDA